MFITITEVYKVHDGSLFHEKEKAERYVLDQAAEFFDKKLNALIKAGKATRADTYTIIQALIPDIPALTEIYQQLSKLTLDD